MTDRPTDSGNKKDGGEDQCLVVFRQVPVKGSNDRIIAWKVFQLMPGQTEIAFEVSSGMQLSITDEKGNLLDLQPVRTGQQWAIVHDEAACVVRQLQSKLDQKDVIQVSNDTTEVVNVALYQLQKVLLRRNELKPGEQIAFRLDANVYLGIYGPIQEGEEIDFRELKDYFVLSLIHGMTQVQLELTEDESRSWKIKSASVGK